ncbi:MAG: Subtilisin-like serine protease [Candidatus Methanohalarchaeum thermophilum]|uniref:Subtilisin-like serine protease n=1 Tax=Methanohalarchaeum thermophilum TaxID=1903181 RepID=A0A1Q6DXC0_METT1|nr:MAG: Subtilisin-like serine protease [Candidatus Methanohalarchaeum thermophilum]
MPLQSNVDNSKEKVIIGFNNEIKTSTIKNQNGEVTHKFEFIKAVSAKIPAQAKNALKKNPNIEYIEKDRKVEALGETLPWGIDRIDAEKVWGDSDGTKEVTKNNNGSGVQVAIIDTGIDYTHPDLDENYLDGYDFVNGDDDPKDDNGHGTHVAGTIAAIDNTEGVIGAAPKVGIYSIKALDDEGSGYISDIVAGIEWAIENDAEVVSMSLGASSEDESLKNAVNKAYQNGTLPIAAAGNNGDGDASTNEWSYPAAYDSVIAVGATDKNNDVASFSNSGPYLEVVAPGVKILSTMPTYDVSMTSSGPPWTLYDKNYDELSGTSMACPHVSGTAALVYSAGVEDYDGDGNTADDVREILNSTADDLGINENLQGEGIINATNAINNVEPIEKHDIAVAAINTTNEVIQGEETNIIVTVENQGTYLENSNITLTDEHDQEEIGNKSIELDAGDSTTYEFTWDTTGEDTTNHTLNASIDPVENETEISDNSENTTVKVEEPSLDTPEIDNFSITEVNSPSPHVEFEINWKVSDDGGNLKTVEITLVENDTDNVVDSETIDISGSIASDITTVKDKHAEGDGKKYEITLIVTDNNSNQAESTKRTEES